MRMFREVRENREVERNLTYVNQESDVTNNENGSASDKEAISNAEFRARALEYFKRLAEATTDEERSKIKSPFSE